MNYRSEIKDLSEINDIDEVKSCYNELRIYCNFLRLNLWEVQRQQSITDQILIEIMTKGLNPEIQGAIELYFKDIELFE